MIALAMISTVWIGDHSRRHLPPPRGQDTPSAVVWTPPSSLRLKPNRAARSPSPFDDTGASASAITAPVKQHVQRPIRQRVATVP